MATKRRKRPIEYQLYWRIDHVVAATSSEARKAMRKRGWIPSGPVPENLIVRRSKEEAR